MPNASKRDYRQPQAELLGFMAKGQEYELAELAAACCQTRKEASKQLALLQSRGHIRKIVRYVRVTEGPRKIGRAAGMSAVIWQTLNVIPHNKTVSALEVYYALPASDACTLVTLQHRLRYLRQQGWLVGVHRGRHGVQYNRTEKPLPPGRTP